MATPKKKHLIELMIEAGVKWPDGAEYAAQDKFNLCVNFFASEGAPVYHRGNDSWSDDEEGWLGIGCGVYLPSLCRNWHQTIVTREQYALALTAVTPDVQQEAQPEQKYCASVMRQMPDNTIEQLTADYHAKAAEADHLQAVANEALKAADDALLALEKAGELIGLVISIDTNQKLVKQPNITDWRDLRVGDVILCVSQGCKPIDRLNWVVGEECEVVELEEPGISGQPIRARFKNGEKWWVGEFRFIRRP